MKSICGLSVCTLCFSPVLTLSLCPVLQGDGVGLQPLSAHCFCFCSPASGFLYIVIALLPSWLTISLPIVGLIGSVLE